MSDERTLSLWGNEVTEGYSVSDVVWSIKHFETRPEHMFTITTAPKPLTAAVTVLRDALDHARLHPQHEVLQELAEALSVLQCGIRVTENHTTELDKATLEMIDE